MVSFEHKQLINLIARGDEVPQSEGEYEAWRTGVGHVEVLRANAREGEELILAVLSPRTFVHTAVVSADHPGISDRDGLVKWSCTLFCHSASTLEVYVGRDGVGFESREHGWGTDSLSGGFPLVYGRIWEGMDGPDGMYYEIAQPYVHHLDAHWRSERRSYCRFDRRGDFEDVVSITNAGSEDVTLVSFKRDPLDQYLVEHNSVLIQLFEFMFRRPHISANWSESSYVHHGMDRGLAFFQQFAGDGSLSMARGVQIVRPRLSLSEVEERIRNWSRVDPQPGDPVEFKVWDWRHRKVATVTTDPATTTNYFAADAQSLPFETSPAFFRPEVLSKYRADSEKYTLHENWIACRGGWELRRYSANSAGQIAVYICDLRLLPHEEQLHWAIYNEDPKAGLSDRTITTDFLGEWPDAMTPREMLVDSLQRWQSLGMEWWKWRHDDPPDRKVVVPRIGSRDEWAKALVDLHVAVIEGFEVKELRQMLRTEGVEVDKQWRSIALLERILRARSAVDEDWKLSAFRDLNDGRRFSGVHFRGSQSEEYIQTILQEHETYSAHFQHLCRGLASDMTLIESALIQGTGLGQ